MKAREPRRKVLIRARMRVADGWHDACLLNISSRGVLVQAPTAPPRGSYLEVRRGGHVIVARVVWARGHRFGIRSQDMLPIDAIIAEPGETAAQAPASPQVLSTERRSRSRPVETRHQRSRERGRALEFAGTLLFGAIAASVVCSAVAQALDGPMARIGAALR